MKKLIDYIHLQLTYSFNSFQHVNSHFISTFEWGLGEILDRLKSIKVYNKFRFETSIRYGLCTKIYICGKLQYDGLCGIGVNEMVF